MGKLFGSGEKSADSNRSSLVASGLAGALIVGSVCGIVGNKVGRDSCIEGVSIEQDNQYPLTAVEVEDVNGAINSKLAVIGGESKQLDKILADLMKGDSRTVQLALPSTSQRPNEMAKSSALLDAAAVGTYIQERAADSSRTVVLQSGVNLDAQSQADTMMVVNTGHFKC